MSLQKTIFLHILIRAPTSSNIRTVNMKSIGCIGLAALLVLSSGRAWPQPMLRVAEGTKLDLGTINRGKVVEKKISLKNIGNETLVIGKVITSCGCTGTVVSEDHIPPGESGTLLITFNSKNFSGTIHKTVTVNSNSAGGPETLIEFTGIVFEEVLVTPSQLLFRDAEVGRLSSRTVIVKNNGKEKLLLTGFKTQLPGLTAILPSKSIAPDDSAQIVVEFKPTQVQPMMTDLLHVTTSNKSQPDVTIYVYGNTKEFKFQ